MANIEKIKLSKKAGKKFSIVNNSFRQKTKDDWRERITTEIGDVKEADFFPQVKIGKWGDDEETNEVNFSMRLVETDKSEAAIEEDNGKIKYKKEKYEAHFKDVEACENHPEGAFDFDILLNEKPASNRLEFSLETKGLEFFYQPALNTEKLEEGQTADETHIYDKDGNVVSERPENVVGSYAVYYKSCPPNKLKKIDKSKYTQDELNEMVKAGTHIGKENKKGEVEYFELSKLYKVGKVGHIYRPKITDNKGNECWGTLTIDIEAKRLYVDIPPEFLATAAYPVLVDPTFGYTTAGSSSSRITDAIYGSVFGSAAGEATKLSAYVFGPGSGEPMKTAIYIDSSSSKLAETGAQNPNGALWQDFTFSSNPEISSIDYILVAGSDGSGSPVHSSLYYDSGDTNQGHYQTITYPTFPSTASFSNNNNKYSIYATYTESGGTPIGVSDTGSGSDSVSVKVNVGISDNGEGVDSESTGQKIEKNVEDSNLPSISYF